VFRGGKREMWMGEFLSVKKGGKGKSATPLQSREGKRGGVRDDIQAEGKPREEGYLSSFWLRWK